MEMVALGRRIVAVLALMVAAPCFAQGALEQLLGGGDDAELAAMAGDNQAIILTIDGIDPDMTGGGLGGALKNLTRAITGQPSAHSTDEITGRGDSYLAGPIEESWPFAVDVRHYSWTGDLTRTESDLENLKIQIKGLAEIANRRGQAFIIVAHSWGSVLAYRAISELWGHNQLKPDSIRKVVTLGSPIDAQNSAYKATAFNYLNWAGPSAVIGPAESWTNFWIEKDSISGPIESLDDNVNLRYSFADPHNAYFNNQALFRQIGESVAQDLASFVAPSALTSVMAGPVGRQESAGVQLDVAAESAGSASGANSTSVQVVAADRLPGHASIPYSLADLENLRAGLAADTQIASCGNCELGAVQLANIDLTATSFSSANMPCADFSGSDFYKPNDQSRSVVSTEKSSSFREAYLVKADFSSSSLIEADFVRATLTGAKFDSADLTRADLGGALLADVSLEGANLEGANLNGADLSGAALRGANLKDAKLLGTKVSASELERAILCNTLMPNGQIEFSGCEGGNSTVRPSTVNVRHRKPSGQASLGMELERIEYEVCETALEGRQVSRVDWGSLAWSVGIQAGDIIQHVERGRDYYVRKCERITNELNRKRCLESISERTNRIQRAGCRDLYFLEWTRKKRTRVLPLNSLTLPAEGEPSEEIELFVVRDGRLHIVRVNFEPDWRRISAMGADCPAYVASLETGRPEKNTQHAGNYRGASLESIVFRGEPAMRVLSVDSGSAMEEVGVRAGDILRTQLSRHIKFGDINTAAKLKLMEQDTYDRNPNNPYSPFVLSVDRDGQSFWVDLPRREIPK